MRGQPDNLIQTEILRRGSKIETPALHPIKLKRRVIDEIRKHAQSASDEVAGLLLGSLRGGTLLVNDVVTGEQVSTRTHVTLGDEFLVKAAIEYGRRGKKKSIVGWYHSHPALGCFVSGTDFETQKRFQALFPDAVGVIIDPSPPEKLAVFRIGQTPPTDNEQDGAMT